MQHTKDAGLKGCMQFMEDRYRIKGAGYEGCKKGCMQTAVQV